MKVEEVIFNTRRVGKEKTGCPERGNSMNQQQNSRLVLLDFRGLNSDDFIPGTEVPRATKAIALTESFKLMKQPK